METAITFSLSLPKSWAELTSAQQIYVYFLLSEGYDAAAIRSFCLLRWSGIKVLAAQGRNNYLVQYGEKRGFLSAWQLAAAATELAFLNELPQVPVRPECIDGHKALPADLMGVAFEKYLCLDNLYQGFLRTQDEGIIRDMAAILYDAQDIRLTKTQTVAVFYWFASVKTMLRNRFTSLFQPFDPTHDNMLGGASLAIHLQEAMDAQIRALTKGDVTKEAEVLQLDTWRALTELNAQAKEYEELRRNNK